LSDKEESKVQIYDSANEDREHIKKPEHIQRHEHVQKHEHKSENKRSNSSDTISININFTKIIAVVQLILIAVLVWQVATISNKLDNAATASAKLNDAIANIPTQAAPAQNPSGQPSAPTITDSMKTIAADRPVEGDANAPVTIVEFADFECPFCQQWFKNTFPDIKKNFIDTGKAKLVFRDLPLVNLHQHAEKAAEAARCAEDQGKFWEMHDKLFGEGVGNGITTFKQYASDLGLDTAKFNQCLDSGVKKADVDKDAAAGSKYGITGTPSFIIEQQLLVGAQPYSKFEQALNSAAAGN